MAPRGRPPKRTARMNAAVDAMAALGFAAQVVKAKMRELLKAYDGEYKFIEEDAYRVLLDALLADPENGNQHGQNEEVALGETSTVNELVESEPVEDGHEVVPTSGFIDIPICSSTPILVLPPPPPPPEPLVAPIPPPPEMTTALPPPPLLPPPVMTPVLAPPEKAQPRIRTKPCYGFIDSDDEHDWKFITLPSILKHSMSPPKRPPAQPESTNENNNLTPKRRSRWDLKPEDMQSSHLFSRSRFLSSTTEVVGAGQTLMDN